MKLNNKGFTLVELISAVVIISLLTIIISSNVLNSLKNSKEKSYEIVVENIITASKGLFEEVYSNELLGVSDTSILYKYKEDGNKTTDEINISNETTNEINISNKQSIIINLQTLVSNGFLTGSTNTTETGAKKIILNPKNQKNMGECQIKITKIVNQNGKVTYTIEPEPLESETNNDFCPTTDDYKKGVN